MDGASIASYKSFDKNDRSNASKGKSDGKGLDSIGADVAEYGLSVVRSSLRGLVDHAIQCSWFHIKDLLKQGAEKDGFAMYERIAK